MRPSGSRLKKRLSTMGPKIVDSDDSEVDGPSHPVPRALSTLPLADPRLAGPSQ